MRSWPGANCNPCHLAQRMQPLSPKSVCHDQDPGVCCPFCRSPFLGCSLPVLHLVQPTARAYLDLLRARMRDACVTLISTCNLSATARRRREEKRTQQKHADVVPMHRVDDSAVIPGNSSRLALRCHTSALVLCDFSQPWRFWGRVGRRDEPIRRCCDAAFPLKSASMRPSVALRGRHWGKAR